jgi:hypothetical protein
MARRCGGSPAEFAMLIADETEKWGKVIKLANIKRNLFSRCCRPSVDCGRVKTGITSALGQSRRASVLVGTTPPAYLFAQSVDHFWSFA